MNFHRMQIMRTQFIFFLISFDLLISTCGKAQERDKFISFLGHYINIPIVLFSSVIRIEH